MSLDDDHHASSTNISTKMRVRRSMDIEFHDHLYDSLFDEIKEWDAQNNQEQNGPKQEGEVDDDSFGEATNNCQPDHEFLEQILEEYHPERINLLETSVPESVYIKKPRGSESSISSNAKATEQSDSATPPSGTVASSLSARSNGANDNDDTRPILKSKKVDESESHNEDDGDDTFLKSPQRGNDRTTLFGTVGGGTKGSLRTINGTFWSKPFKGLTPSVHGDEDATSVTD